MQGAAHRQPRLRGPKSFKSVRESISDWGQEAYCVERLVDEGVVNAKEVHGGALWRQKAEGAEEKALREHFDRRAQPRHFRTRLGGTA